MANVRLVVGDQSSAEVDQMRKSLNGLITVLENIAGTTFTTVADLQEALANSLSTGSDGDFTTATSSDAYVGTGAEIVGLRPMNRHPRRPGFVAGDVSNVKAMTLDDVNQ